MRLLSEKEKQALLYRPHLEYTPEEIDAPALDYSNDYGAADPDIILNNKVSDTMQALKDVQTETSKLIKKIEDKYLTATDAAAPVTAEDRLYLETVKLHGYQVPNLDKGITFSIYRNAMLNAPDMIRDIIMDIYELHHMSEYGKIECEVYRDLYEIYNDVSSSIDSFKLSGLKQVSITADESKLSGLENEDIDTLYTVLNKVQELEKTLISATVGGQMGTNVSEAQANYDILQKSLYYIRDRVMCRAEVSTVYKAKTENYTILLPKLEELINRTTDSSFEDITADISELVALFQKSDMLALKASTKLALDASVKKVHEIDKKRRSMAFSSMKRTVDSDIIHGAHIRSQLIQPLTRTLLTSSDVSYGVEKILDIVSDGIVESDDKYQEHLKSLYTLDLTDAAMLEARLEEVEKKDDIRNYYKLMNALCNFVGEKGRTPNNSEIGSIVSSIGG